jgi:hypothetical protein
MNWRASSAPYARKADVVPLLVGTVLAVLGLAYVLLPLLRGASTSAPVPLAPDLPPEASALDALREIEFDQATGKLSDEDYATLKAEYTPLALAELRARENADAAARGETGSNIEDAAEQMIARAKQRGMSCGSCGSRPEPDALYCSDCGRFLGVACLSCGAPVPSDTARFCTECGAALAA